MPPIHLNVSANTSGLMTSAIEQRPRRMDLYILGERDVVRSREERYDSDCCVMNWICSKSWYDEISRMRAYQ